MELDFFSWQNQQISDSKIISCVVFLHSKILDARQRLTFIVRVEKWLLVSDPVLKGEILTMIFNDPIGSKIDMALQRVSSLSRWLIFPTGSIKLHNF